MAPYGMPRIALNFLDGDEGGRARAAFGVAKYERLRTVKREWDPGNLFRSNANIAP
jgi:hypothetical protein